MRTYTFRYYVTKTVDVVVEADSDDEANDKASARIDEIARSIDLITEADSTDIELIDAED
jgi:hypothetical protein